MDSRFIAIDGLQTHYLTAGSGEPVVLVHGGGPGTDSQANWSTCSPLLAQHFTVYAPDLIGSGRSVKPSPQTYGYTQDDRNAHVIGFIEALGIAPVHLVGNAQGGGTVLGVTIQRPDLVRKLVVNGGLGTRGASEQNAAVRPYLPSQDVSLDMVRGFVRTCLTDDFPIPEDEVRYRFDLLQQPGALDAYQTSQAWMAARGGVYYDDAQLEAITAPTLMIWAKHNRVAPLDRGVRFIELIPNSWLYVMANSGHFTMIMRPEEFSRTVSDFLLHTG